MWKQILADLNCLLFVGAQVSGRTAEMTAPAPWRVLETLA
ncbi:hypothetical protein CEV34_1682 [Brucella pseudogrignonensis]|uniref:Uncharacterized protein n=1 Tax=Brucella pseudogrignonensis TaxID=419475 RepID=A0A256GMH0_9HYPH|nr:hypothetical protein CEV34_1682 [Brucella pseudogrignonensis]